MHGGMTTWGRREEMPSTRPGARPWWEPPAHTRVPGFGLRDWGQEVSVV